jgi:hypothetical protein
VVGIYCTGKSHRKLNELGIKLTGRHLRRPPKAGREKLNSGDRNPIEGKYCQCNVSYGMELINARL